MLTQTYSLDTTFVCTLQLRQSNSHSLATNYTEHFPPTINQTVSQMPNSFAANYINAIANTTNLLVAAFSMYVCMCTVM